MDGATLDMPEQTKPLGTIKCRGMVFPKHPQIIRGQIRGSLRKETYEAREANSVLKVVRADDVVMELGGGIGFMSTHIAKNRKIKHIHVFEANPNLAPYINDVHRANGISNATVHHALLGKRKGTADFYVRKKILASSLDKDALPGITDTVQVDVLNVKTVLNDIKPTVLVCDIEGAEADLIPQMDLSKLRAAVIETHPQWIGPAGVNKVFQHFMDAGLAYYARGSVNKVVSFRRNWTLR